MREVFPYVFAIDVDRYNNTMLIGVTDPASIDAFIVHSAETETSGLLAEVTSVAIHSGNIRPGPDSARVFTDDHAPIELYTDLVILDAAREGD